MPFKSAIRLGMHQCARMHAVQPRAFQIELHCMCLLREARLGFLGRAWLVLHIVGVRKLNLPQKRGPQY